MYYLDSRVDVNRIIIRKSCAGINSDIPRGPRRGAERRETTADGNSAGQKYAREHREIEAGNYVAAVENN